MSDIDLVARARQGDTAAFGELVERHRPAVYRAALTGLGSHAEAQDAAQEAFLSAYRQLAGFRGEATFKTWLLVITWHHVRNRRRSLARWWRRFESNNGSSRHVEPPTPAPSPEQAFATNELRRAVRDEIRSLSPKLHDALLLMQSGEYTYEELAVMLKAPVGTVKWRVSEARRIVKQRLRERGHGHVG